MSEDIKDVQNEETQVMTFLDENGNKVQFEAVARIYLEEKEYLLLAPMEDKESEDIYVFRIDEVEGKQELNLVEDDKEFIAVKKEYNNCFLFPILSLTHPAIGAPNPKTNKYTDIMEEV